MIIPRDTWLQDDDAYRARLQGIIAAQARELAAVYDDNATLTAQLQTAWAERDRLAAEIGELRASLKQHEEWAKMRAQ